MQHDVATDPLPTETFDVIHTRLVLMHVRERNRALDTLIASLKPGGWFVGEEFDALSTLADPSISASEALLKTGVAMRRLMADRGGRRPLTNFVVGAWTATVSELRLSLTLDVGDDDEARCRPGGRCRAASAWPVRGRFHR